MTDDNTSATETKQEIETKDHSKLLDKPKPSKKTAHIVGALTLVFFVYNVCFVYVKPDQYGIKVERIGLNRGVHKEIYNTGLHPIIPFGFQQIYRLPKGIQVLEMTRFSDKNNYTRKEKSAHIQTSDGFFVDIDVSILYQIVDPYLVFTKIGPGNLYEDNGIIPKAEPVLKSTLGELTTEEFYNSPLRTEKANLARDLLNEELKEKGIKVNHVLVRYFTYSDEIERNIEEKKLKDQLVFRNQAEARAAAEGAKLLKIIEEGKVAVEVAKEKGAAYVTRKNAERDLYLRTKKAEANLLVKLAEAEKVKLKNEALRGQGATRMVGLEMADVYKGLDTIILPSDGPSGVNPLNLKNALNLFDMKKGE